MHECPFCGEVCDCDMDDTWLPQPANCIHVCEESDDYWDGDIDEEYADGVDLGGDDGKDSD